MTPEQLPIPEPGVNPAMSDEGTHVATSRLAFVTTTDGFRLCQLFMPCDAAAHAPEWRDVPMFTS